MPSVKLGVTVSPPCTALSRVTVKVISEPSEALASSIVTSAASSLLMVPVPVSVDVTPDGASDTLKLTVKVSLASNTTSAVVATLKLFVSPAVPLKLSAEVFSS